MLEVSRGRDRAIGLTPDGYAAEDDMTETSDWYASGTRAKSVAQDRIIDRDLFWAGLSFKREDEVFPKGVSQVNLLGSIV